MMFPLRRFPNEYEEVLRLFHGLREEDNQGAGENEGGIAPAEANEVPRARTLAHYTLPTVADRLVEASFTADTLDREDHTFSGIMFDVEGLAGDVPFEFIEVHSFSVRGGLGRMSIYSKNGSCYDAAPRLEDFPRVYGPCDVPESTILKELVLDVPIRIPSGGRVAVYIHSETPGDQAVVYANRRNRDCTYADRVLKIYPGVAHISNTPFRGAAHWGGTAWRPGREFVGRIRYGVKRRLWTPKFHSQFSPQHRQAVMCVLTCQVALNRRRTTPGVHLGRVPVMVLLHVFNMLPYDWFEPPEEAESDHDRSTVAGDYLRFAGRVVNRLLR